MRRFTFAAAVTTVAGVILVASACSSVPEITYGNGTPGTDSSSSGSTSSGNSGTTSSSGTPTDGPIDVVSDCKATGPEICDDGIDNDCNQKTDCADDQCKPVTECVDPAPAGWTLVSFADATRPPCATGYDAPIDLKVVNGIGTGNCNCNCNAAVGKECTSGSFSVAVDSTNACGAGAANIAHNTNCTPLPNNINIPNPNAFAAATPPAGPAAGECTAVTVPEAGPITLGKTCGVSTATKFGKGCTTATQQCAPKAAGFEVCITKLGTDTCPTPYTDRKTAGTDAVDTRSCNACTCEPKGCTGSIELFSEADCTVGGNKRSTGAIDSSCDAITGNFTATRYKSTLAAPLNGCGFAAGGFNNAMAGNITWTEQRTVCCKP